MHFNCLPKVLIILFICMNFISIIYAEEIAETIVGAVRDEEDNPLPGVNITIRSPVICYDKKRVSIKKFIIQAR